MKTLHEKIAAKLGWTVKEAQQFSLSSLREIVKPVDPQLADELTEYIQNGVYFVEKRKYVKTLTEDERREIIRHESHRIGIERMTDMMRQGFWPKGNRR